MRLKTVLNRVHKVKGFVYEQARFRDDEIEITVRLRRRSRPICDGCGRHAYRHMKPWVWPGIHSHSANCETFLYFLARGPSQRRGRR